MKQSRRRWSPLRKHSDGYYEYMITTPFGTRSVSTGKTNLEEAKQFVKDAGAEQIITSAQITNFQHRVISQLTAGRPIVSCYDVLLEWIAWQQELNISMSRIKNGKTFLTTWLRTQDLTNAQVQSITLRDINAYVNADDEAKLSTRNVRLAFVQSYFKYAVTMHGVKDLAKLCRVDRRRLTHAQKETAEKKIFTDADFWAYIAEVRKLYDHYMGLRLEHNRLALQGRRPFANNLHEYWIDRALFYMVGAIISRFTGLRMGDVACLEWDSLETSMRKTIEVWTRKTGTRIEMPIPDIVNEYLLMLPKVTWMGKEEPYLFPSIRTLYLGVKHEIDSARGSAYFTAAFRRFCEKAGIPAYTWSCLRHTFATEVEAKHGIKLAQQWMGHTNYKQTEHYVHREQLAEQKMHELLAEEAAQAGGA